VPLTNQNTSMMNALCQSELQDLGLKTALKKVLQAQTEHVIELHLLFIEHSDTNQATQQSITCLSQSKAHLFGQIVSIC